MNTRNVQEQATPLVPALKITQAFQRAKHEGRGVLIPYFMCGYPSASQSVQVILAAAEGGADIIELGMPFSDPLADGATIQHAGHIALERGMTLKGCMEVAREVSSQTDVPLILMGYYNPVLAYGLERFCADANAHGVSGLIIPDLPPEEADRLEQAAYQYGLALIFLIPPTAPDERIQLITERVAAGHGGFIYCISLSGVTGSRSEISAHLSSFLARVRKYTQEKQIPMAVGFGLSTPEHIATVTQYAEGAVVGSALVNLIDQKPEAEQQTAIKNYIQSLSKGLPNQ
ncbi:tryptophan synthase subunit alpha [Tengunoibacter tsumagoiensis]|uniref:Tryptophan synthase alpha chain n=1 Tax=Tengunoibacter tsumagoiensis TaxID=2014871 RepID=A0A401ZZM2_9CHLR|nr:tryptophan synthase subunit alpha [Tengunoibacter tsumagoiensis]GCE12242.1 tryptophan synthase alpha chain [Tengunoibacter tsumagoiensis]